MKQIKFIELERLRKRQKQRDMVKAAGLVVFFLACMVCAQVFLE